MRVTTGFIFGHETAMTVVNRLADKGIYFEYIPGETPMKRQIRVDVQDAKVVRALQSLADVQVVFTIK